MRIGDACFGIVRRSTAAVYDSYRAGGSDEYRSKSQWYPVKFEEFDGHYVCKERV